jgi:competence protein ComFC
VHRITQVLLRFFLPWACASCRVPLASLEDHGFCGRCWLALPRIEGIICHRCGLPLKDGGTLCYSCRQAPPPLKIRAAVEFRGVIPPAVYRFKYRGRKSLAAPFASMLRYAWEHSPELHGIHGIIPVPLYTKNERIRGYNQADLLARELAGIIARPVIPILTRVRKTDSQVNLNRQKRQLNLRNAFRLNPTAVRHLDLLRGKSFLLIDDVCTTTTTLGECAKVLHKAGIRSVHALVLARDL